jgi:uncharacterized membrane protein
MKSFLKNLGIFVILIGVIVLALTTFNGSTSNTPLAFSAGFIVVGLILQIVMGRYID